MLAAFGIAAFDVVAVALGADAVVVGVCCGTRDFVAGVVVVDVNTADATDGVVTGVGITTVAALVVVIRDDDGDVAITRSGNKSDMSRPGSAALIRARTRGSGSTRSRRRGVLTTSLSNVSRLPRRPERPSNNKPP